MSAYYNEVDAKKAAWLREVIRAGLAAPGDVDERSIVDVRPDDLHGYVQCHFFAGIGVWSYALRNAGWADDRPVWTGSCPCQPFSNAGRQKGGADDRHLWPHWFRLIRECRPDPLFGEQVESAIRHGWLDAVCSDMEGEGYAVGSAVFGAHSVGSPHRRQRLYFVVHPERERLEGHGGNGDDGNEPRRLDTDAARPTAAASSAGGMACPGEGGWAVERASRLHDHGQPGHDATGRGAAGELADAESIGRQQRGQSQSEGPHRSIEPARQGAAGFWAYADWIACSDGKARPTEPGTFPLAYGTPARVLRLRGYGDAIVAPQAQAFIEAYLDVRGAA